MGTLSYVTAKDVVLKPGYSVRRRAPFTINFTDLPLGLIEHVHLGPRPTEPANFQSGPRLTGIDIVNRDKMISSCDSSSNFIGPNGSNYYLQKGYDAKKKLSTSLQLFCSQFKRIRKVFWGRRCIM